ncbi:hypothetical protein HBB16_20220 [Pseudonocardia sp. MCCB 268]|nr:hypothetical protein [Pseudonocardia cytotoxica]
MRGRGDRLGRAARERAGRAVPARQGNGLVCTTRAYLSRRFRSRGALGVPGPAWYEDGRIVPEMAAVEKDRVHRRRRGQADTVGVWLDQVTRTRSTRVTPYDLR